MAGVTAGGTINCTSCGAPVPAEEFAEGGRGRMLGAQRFCPLCAQTVAAGLLRPEEVAREELPKLRLPRFSGETDSTGVERRAEWQRRKAPPEPKKRPRRPLRLRRRERGKGR